MPKPNVKFQRKGVRRSPTREGRRESDKLTKVTPAAKVAGGIVLVVNFLYLLLEALNDRCSPLS